jgi:hypothetical protein
MGGQESYRGPGLRLSENPTCAGSRPGPSRACRASPASGLGGNPVIRRESADGAPADVLPAVCAGELTYCPGYTRMQGDIQQPWRVPIPHSKEIP